MVSIPFELGDVFRHFLQPSTALSQQCLNPFRAGRCLSTFSDERICAWNDKSQSLSSRAMSFDANGALVSSFTSVSQSLSSRAMSFDVSSVIDLFGNTAVSIPFEQGDVFRPENEATRTVRIQSQSLSSRAMSFDLQH